MNDVLYLLGMNVCRYYAGMSVEGGSSRREYKFPEIIVKDGIRRILLYGGR